MSVACCKLSLLSFPWNKTIASHWHKENFLLIPLNIDGSLDVQFILPSPSPISLISYTSSCNSCMHQAKSIWLLHDSYYSIWRVPQVKGFLLRSDSNLQLISFCDSDWRACLISRQSLSAYFIMLGRSSISWCSKKQATVFRSLAEAEYYSMALTTSELVWLRSFLASLGIFSSPMWHCDSQVALHITHNPVFQDRAKHIEIDCHFVREKLKAGIITLAHVGTQHQPVDIFTKTLNEIQF